MAAAVLMAATCMSTGVLPSGTPAADAAAGTDTLNPNENLLPNQALWSAGGRYMLIMQSDGQLVEYDMYNGAVMWSTWPATAGHPNDYARMQSDGNFVVYPQGGGTALWSTYPYTSGYYNDHLVLQSDGNTVIYLGNSAPWASNTRSCCATFVRTAPNNYSAVGYAEAWWNGTNSYGFGPRYSNDCQDFVSQVLTGGGTGQNGSWAYNTYNWYNVPGFANYSLNSHYENGVHYAVPSALTSQQSLHINALPGDPIVYEWDSNQSGWDHSASEISYEYVTNWSGTIDGISGQLQYNAYVDLIDQHTTDRHKMPWNAGYWFHYWNGDNVSYWNAQVIHINAL